MSLKVIVFLFSIILKVAYFEQKSIGNVMSDLDVESFGTGPNSNMTEFKSFLDELPNNGSLQDLALMSRNFGDEEKQSESQEIKEKVWAGPYRPFIIPCAVILMFAGAIVVLVVDTCFNYIELRHRRKLKQMTTRK